MYRVSRIAYSGGGRSSVVGGLIAGALLVAASARANDGDLTLGGSPRLMDGHPSVAMRSEVVRMTVGKENVKVDCRFVFENTGPACTVRMGFPDDDARQEPGEDQRGKPPRSFFSSFKSYVDGKPVETKLVWGEEQGARWHVKTVRFPANSRHEVRDVYVVHVGAQITQLNTVAHQTSYILHTGASWHGPIGRSELIVTFDRPDMPDTLAPRLMEAPEKTRIFSKPWPGGKDTVYYRGPSKPTVEGRTLRFVRTNWRPTKADDIYLVFDNRKMAG